MTKEELLKQRDTLESFVSFTTYSLDCYKRSLEQCNQELGQLLALQKPKYTAKDFPCLCYSVGDIEFLDDNNLYIITKDKKQITPRDFSTINLEHVDSHIDITECKLSDIKVGDYFAWVNPDSKVSKYRYCTSFFDDYDGRYLYYDCGDTGYIRNARIPMDDIRSSEWEFVKFILKDK